MVFSFPNPYPTLLLVGIKSWTTSLFIETIPVKYVKLWFSLGTNKHVDISLSYNECIYALYIHLSAYMRLEKYNTTQ